MAALCEWNNHKFEVSSTVIRTLKDLTITGGIVSEDKTEDKQKYKTRKSGDATKITLTALLRTDTGCKVYSEAMAFVNEAQAGATGYFYVNGAKLVTSSMMLTKAQVEDVEISPNGTWVSAEVGLTLEQADKNGSGTSSSKSGGSGSGKSKSKLSATVLKGAKKAAEVLTKTTEGTKTTAQSEITRVTGNAKKSTKTSKKTATTIGASKVTKSSKIVKKTK